MTDSQPGLADAIRSRQNPRAGLLAGGGVLAILLSLDVILGSKAVLAGTFILAPPLAALFGDSRSTALIAAGSIVLAAASGAWNDNFGTLDYWIRLAVVGGGGLLAFVSARLQAGWTVTASEQARISEERAEIGDVLQRSLMPEPLPPTPGWSIGALFRPGGDQNVVGGDFYDVFPFGRGWMAVIGDITGKGVGAASLTAQARHALRTSRALTNDPQEVLATLNDSLLNREEPELCSLLALFFGAGETVTIALAGHPPALLVTPDGTSEVGHTGPVLGAFESTSWPLDSVELGPGRHLVGYTDGVTEFESAEGRFDVDRLSRAVEPTGGPAGAIHAIESALNRFARGGAFDDDVTLLALGVAPQLLEATGTDQGFGD